MAAESLQLQSIEAEPSDVWLADDGMLFICGMPTFRVEHNSFVFRDKDKLRCASRGASSVRVKVSYIVSAIKAKLKDAS